MAVAFGFSSTSTLPKVSTVNIALKWKHLQILDAEVHAEVSQATCSYIFLL